MTASSIKVGGLATLSGASQATYQDSITAAEARFARENARGGVFGRKIDYVGGADDGATSSQNVDAGRKLAESKKVFAVVPVATSFSGYADVLCKDVVPAFGWAFNTGLCNNTIGFGYTGCLIPGSKQPNGNIVAPFDPLFAKGSDKTIALLGVDDESARIGLRNYAAAFKHAGIKVVLDDSSLTPGTPTADLSPLVQKIMTADGGKPPTVVYHITDFPNVLSLTQALDAAGYKGQQVSAVGYDPRLAKMSAFADANTLLQTLPYESRDNPVVKQMSADLRQYGHGVTLGLPAMIGWVSADMFIAGLKATGRNLTVDSFLRTLNGGTFTYGDGAFVGKSYWPLNHVVGVPCGVIVRLHDGTYQPRSRLTCNRYFRE